jgi:hypothetical protein
MYVIRNGTEATIPFRDDEGKVFIEAGHERVLQGDQHAPAARAAGFTVTWVQSHRDIIATERRIEAAKAEPEEKPKTKKATVKAREE